MEEKELARVLQTDLSVGTESFRDALLGRCLSVLGADDDAFLLDDATLDMLAAAGGPDALNNNAPGFGAQSSETSL